MYGAVVVRLKIISLIVSFLFLTACGGGSSDRQTSTQPQLFIEGAGIKGPLAFASVELYQLNTNFGELFDRNNPIASATTNAYAEIDGLQVPAGFSPPYILLINGRNAIDLNTGVTPVIERMVTIITRESLESGRPVYATPYTTLAYNMLIVSNYESPNVPLEITLAEFNKTIIGSIGFGMPSEIDLFGTPPIVTGNTITIEEQQFVVQYRAAIEALSSLLHEIFLSSPDTKTDTLLIMLALDLYQDGVINDSPDGQTKYGLIDIDILSRDPMNLKIANTEYFVRDTVALMDHERAFVGSNSNVPFSTQDLFVNLQPAPFSSTSAVNSPVSQYNNSMNNISGTIISAGLISLIDPSAPEVKFYKDLNDDVPRVYTEQDLRDEWDITTGGISDEAVVEIAVDPKNSGRGNVMKITYPAGMIWKGGVWNTPIEKNDDLYFAYDIMFDEDFDFVQGGKIPGLMAGPKDYGGANDVIDGSDGWMGRMMWRTNGAMETLLAYKGQSNRYGSSFMWNYGPEGQRYFVPGKWHRVQMRYKMNTVGRKDGILQTWFDGELAYERTNVEYRTVNTVAPDKIVFSTFFGGGDLSWAPSTDQRIYFDNFVVSTKRIP